MSEEQYHIIEQYINDELAGEALIAFEEQLLQDAELRETLQVFKMLNKEMPLVLKNKPGAEELKKNLRKLSNRHFNKPETPVVKIKKNSWYKLSAAAAVFIVIAGLMFWQFLQREKPSLYAQYIGHETISLTSRGNSNQDTLSKITEYYNKQQYADVIPLLQTLLQQDTLNIQYQLILSRCYIETSAYEKAFTLLNPAAAGSSAYKYDAVWLTAMAWLKQNKNTECITALQKIPAGDDHYTETQELLNVLTKK